MPQADPVADILRKAPTSDAIRAEAWDAFEQAMDADDLAKRLNRLPLPQPVKASLWDLKGQQSPSSGTASQQAQEPSQMPSRGFLGRAVDALPAVGGAIGGFVGGVPGAAMGGAAGQGLRTTLQHAAELPGAVADVARNLVAHPSETLAGFEEGAREGSAAALTQGALQGGAQALGAGALKLAGKAGGALMTSALKPAYAMTEKAVKAVELPRVVKTLLDEGVNVTQAGIGKLNTLLSATTKEIDDLIASSGRSVDPVAVVNTARGVVRAAGQQVAPSADQSAARGVIQDFIDTQARDPVTGAVKRIPVQQAQALKQGTYKALGQRAYGETKGAAVETEKALARGLKEGIERALPETRRLNARSGALIEAKDAIAKRVAQASNRDPGGLAWVAENPASFTAFLLARSPAVKSMLARGLYSSAAKASGVPENVIRLGIGALASEGGQ